MRPGQWSFGIEQGCHFPRIQRIRTFGGYLWFNNRVDTLTQVVDDVKPYPLSPQVRCHLKVRTGRNEKPIGMVVNNHIACLGHSRSSRDSACVTAGEDLNRLH